MYMFKGFLIFKSKINMNEKWLEKYQNNVKELNELIKIQDKNMSTVTFENNKLKTC